MPVAAQTQPPTNDEIEISLFGPGVGECIVMHLGEGDWIVVDSCLGAPGEGPVALRYLSELGVNVSSAVRLVVVTHWHNDHIVGIGEVFSKATVAQLVCSAAVDVEDFYEPSYGSSKEPTPTAMSSALYSTSSSDVCRPV